MRRRYRIRRQLAVHIVILGAHRVRDDSRVGPGRERADRKLHPLLAQVRDLPSIDIRGRNLFGFRIDPFHPRTELFAVLRPHRIVERKRRSVMARADHQREVLLREFVGVHVRVRVVAREQHAFGEFRCGPGIEDDAMNARQLLQPLVLGVARRFERSAGRRCL